MANEERGTRNEEFSWANGSTESDARSGNAALLVRRALEERKGRAKKPRALEKALEKR